MKTNLPDENSLEEMVKGVKQNSDLSNWKKNRHSSPIVNLISRLNELPKTAVPNFDATRVRNLVLDRISVPINTTPARSWSLAILPRILRIGIASIGSLLIIASLGLGTAVAALESIPGQAIYPLKKVVENVELKLTPADQKTSLKLKFASKRIEELQLVIEKQETGKLTDEEAQKIITQTIKEFQENTDGAAADAVNEPRVVNKLADLGNKLKAVSVQTEGQVKIELEEALESTRISQDEALKNLEQAGLQIENPPIIIQGPVKASGTLTAVGNNSISIGTAIFHLSPETQYVNFEEGNLEVGQSVEIEGEIEDDTTYVNKIILIIEIPETGETSGSTTEEEPTAETPIEQNPETVEIQEE